MRALGFVPEPPKENVEVGLYIDPICFGGVEEAVVTFVTREPTATLPRRGEATESLPLRLHALVVDASSGRLKNKQEWPTASYNSRVLPGSKGRFIVLTPDRLMLYSAQLELLRQLDIRLSERSIVNRWRAYVSPTGGAIVLGFHPRGDESRKECEWIRTEDLTVLHRWTAKGYSGLFDNISDRALAGILPGIKIREPDTLWRQICSARQDSCGMLPQFINDEILFTHTEGGGPQYFSLIRTDGTVLFHQDFPASEVLSCREPGASPYPARPSADGRRFAIPIGKLRGGSRLLDIAANYSLKEVMVFDLASGAWIARVDAKPLRVTSLRGLALSPDGSQLAFIDQDGVLWLFRIPRAMAAPSTR